MGCFGRGKGEIDGESLRSSFACVGCGLDIDVIGAINDIWGI